MTTYRSSISAERWGLMKLALFDGHHAGPLFVMQIRRCPKRYGNRLPGMLRRQCEKRATPKWADHKAIRKLRNEAKRMSKATGEAYNVDHIVPLLHPLVCGLHVENNMQVLHWRVNAAKSNNYWPDMPFEQLALF